MYPRSQSTPQRNSTLDIILHAQISDDGHCSGVVGFTRSYGVHLREEGIALNAICPNIVRTAISSEVFYNKVNDAGVLVPIEDVITAVEGLLGADTRSGECIEVGPRGTRETKALEPMDEASRLSCELLHERARPVQAAAS